MNNSERGYGGQAHLIALEATLEKNMKDVESCAADSHSTEEKRESEGVEDEKTSAVRVGRRSAIMNVMDFFRRHGVRRLHNHRKVIDLTTTVNAAEMASIENSFVFEIPGLLSQKLRFIYIVVLLWVIWVLMGSAFYGVHDKLGWSFGFYQSLSIGWGIGWVLPPHKQYQEEVLSKVFSLFHIVVGLLFSGFVVLYIANEMESNNNGWKLQLDIRKNVSSTRLESRNWLARCSLLLSRFKVFFFFSVWVLLGFFWYSFSFISNQKYGADYTISTMAGAGYRTIPDNAQSYQFVVSALYVAIAIPLTRVAEGTI